MILLYSSIHLSLASEPQTYFQSWLLSLREAVTGNTSAVHRLIYLLLAKKT